MVHEPERLGEVITAFPELTRVPAMLFLALWDAGERTVRHPLLADLMSRGAGHLPSSDAIRSAKKNLVRSLRTHDAPVEILSISGVGYRMRRLDPHWRWY